LAPDPNPNSPTYNPYVTVDYIEGVGINDAVHYGFVANNLDGRRNGSNAATQSSQPKPIPARQSQGRRQPFRATGLTPQMAQGWPVPGYPQQTFFRQNGQGNQPPNAAGATMDSTFEWYAHLDRQVSNPLELLNVSAFKPHLLTQAFIPVAAQGPPNGPNQVQQHVVPWFNNPNARLYRARKRSALCATHKAPITLPARKRLSFQRPIQIIQLIKFGSSCSSSATRPTPLRRTTAHSTVC
jgi:hypothetical protein